MDQSNIAAASALRLAGRTKAHDPDTAAVAAEGEDHPNTHNVADTAVEAVANDGANTLPTLPVDQRLRTTPDDQSKHVATQTVPTNVRDRSNQTDDAHSPVAAEVEVGVGCGDRW